MWLGSEDETTYNSVVKDMRLPEKQLFGLPVTFDLPEVDGLKTGDKLLLKWKGEEVAMLEAASIWQPNKAPWPCLVAVSQPFLACFRSLRHPSVWKTGQNMAVMWRIAGGGGEGVLRHL